MNRNTKTTVHTRSKPPRRQREHPVCHTQYGNCKHKLAYGSQTIARCGVYAPTLSYLTTRQLNKERLCMKCFPDDRSVPSRAKISAETVEKTVSGLQRLVSELA